MGMKFRAFCLGFQLALYMQFDVRIWYIGRERAGDKSEGRAWGGEGRV